MIEMLRKYIQKYPNTTANEIIDIIEQHRKDMKKAKNIIHHNDPRYTGIMNLSDYHDDPKFEDAGNEDARNDDYRKE